MNKTTLTVIIFLCLLKSIGSYGQFKTTRSFFIRDKEPSLCSSSYIFDSTGLYFSVTGCEGHFSASLGYYSLNDDTVSIHSTKANILPPILQTKETNAGNDSTVKVTLLTRLGEPLPQYCDMDLIEKGGKFLKPTFVNKNGEIIIDTRKYAALRLSFLDHFYHKWIYLDLTNKDVTLTFSLPAMFFPYHHQTIFTTYNDKFIVKQDTIYQYNGGRHSKR